LEATQRELDSDIFTVGVSIPLNFTSDAPKYAKASLKYKSPALELEHERKLTQKIHFGGSRRSLIILGRT